MTSVNEQIIIVSQQCQRQTIKKKQCTRLPQKNSLYCYQHTDSQIKIDKIQPNLKSKTQPKVQPNLNIKSQLAETNIPSQLSSIYRSEKSWNGYQLDILKSGLQKYIRRGDVDKATYCAGELDLFKYSPEKGEGIRTNFIHRLMIIYLEDVGISGIGLWDYLDESIFELLDLRNNSPRQTINEEILLKTMVREMCMSEKTRICSHCRAVTNLHFYNFTEKFPNIRDLQNRIQKEHYTDLNFNDCCDRFEQLLKNKDIICVALGQHISGFETLLENKEYGKRKPVWKLFKIIEKFCTTPTLQKQHQYAMKWYSELQTLKENFLTWYTLILLLIYSPNIDEQKVELVESDSWSVNKTTQLTFDDFIYDIHTRQKGTNTKLTFALEGALVNNESKLTNDEWKQFYNATKADDVLIENKLTTENKSMENVLTENKSTEVSTKNVSIEKNKSLKYESNEYKFMVRTQLVTSARKMDVYFAKDHSNKTVIVKGPYPTISPLEITVNMRDWKRKHNLPVIDCHIVKMIPDMWIQGTSLGIRNSIQNRQTTEAYFLVVDSLIEEREIETKMHNSKLWDDTEVVDWEKVKLHLSITDLDDDEIMMGYVINLLFRFLFGISDLADRNFLVDLTKKIVYSIDEDIEEHDVQFRVELRKNKANMVQNFITNNWNKIEDVVSKWTVTNNYSVSKLSIIQHKNTCVSLFD